MTFLNFDAPAELFLGSDRQSAAAQGSRSFRTAAQAIHFAFEHAAPVSLHGAQLVTGGRTYSAGELPWLYRSPDYPLPRKRQRANVASSMMAVALDMAL